MEITTLPTQSNLWLILKSSTPNIRESHKNMSQQTYLQLLENVAKQLINYSMHWSIDICWIEHLVQPREDGASFSKNCEFNTWSKKLKQNRDLAFTYNQGALFTRVPLPVLVIDELVLGLQHIIFTPTAALGVLVSVAHYSIV